MCDCICLKSLEVSVGMSVVRRRHISSSVDSVLCLLLISLFYIFMLHQDHRIKSALGQPQPRCRVLRKSGRTCRQLLPCPTSRILTKLGLDEQTFHLTHPKGIRILHEILGTCVSPSLVLPAREAAPWEKAFTCNT